MPRAEEVDLHPVAWARRRTFGPFPLLEAPPRSDPRTLFAGLSNLDHRHDRSALAVEDVG